MLSNHMVLKTLLIDPMYIYNGCLYFDRKYIMIHSNISIEMVFENLECLGWNPGSSGYNRAEWP